MHGRSHQSQVTNLKKVIKKPKKTPPKPKLDEDSSFGSADDQILDESHDNSKDEDYDANFMKEDEGEASSESFIESSGADVAPKGKPARR